VFSDSFLRVFFFFCSSFQHSVPYRVYDNWQETKQAYGQTFLLFSLVLSVLAYTRVRYIILSFAFCYLLFSFFCEKKSPHTSFLFVFFFVLRAFTCTQWVPRFELSYRTKYSIQLTLKMQNKNSGVSPCVCGTSKTKGMKSGSSLSIKTRPG
jgi:hypothetical protein